MREFDAYYKEECAKDPGLHERVEAELDTLRIQEKLRQAREKCGLTQEQVARRMNVNRTFVSRLETQSGNMTLSTLERYAHAVGLRCEINLHA